MANYKGVYARLANIGKGLEKISGEDYNAIFFITRYSGTVIVDENSNYSLSDSTPFRIKLTLVSKKDPYITPNPGVDAIRTYMEGYLVSPGGLEGYASNRIDCSLIQNNVTITGRFHFIDYIPSPVEEVGRISLALGQKICGYFEREHNNV